MNEPESEWPEWLSEKAKEVLRDYISFMGENPYRYCFDNWLETVEFPLCDNKEGMLYMTAKGILLRQPRKPMKVNGD